MILRLLAILILQGTDTRPAVQDASTGGLDPKIRQATQKSIERGLRAAGQGPEQGRLLGGPRNKTMTDGFANVETHHSWTVATTGLVCMTLLDTNKGLEANGPLDRGIDYLIANADVKRPADWDIDNSWGLIYGLQGISRALAADRYKNSPKRDAMKKAAATMVKGLEEYQTPEGAGPTTPPPTPRGAPAGWPPRSRRARRCWRSSTRKRPGWKCKKDVPGGRARGEALPAADRRVHLYARAAAERVGDQPRGDRPSERIALADPGLQSCALPRGGQEHHPRRPAQGLDDFFEYHEFLDVGLHKPIPHEAFYAVAAYFYLFGHHYASQVIEALPQKERESYWEAPRRDHQNPRIRRRHVGLLDLGTHQALRDVVLGDGAPALARPARLSPGTGTGACPRYDARMQRSRPALFASYSARSATFSRSTDCDPCSGKYAAPALNVTLRKNPPSRAQLDAERFADRVEDLQELVLILAFHRDDHLLAAEAPRHIRRAQARAQVRRHLAQHAVPAGWPSSSFTRLK
mgnify:CR=1 FL=1